MSYKITNKGMHMLPLPEGAKVSAQAFSDLVRKTPELQQYGVFVGADCLGLIDYDEDEYGMLIETLIEVAVGWYDDPL